MQFPSLAAIHLFISAEIFWQFEDLVMILSTSKYVSQNVAESW
jgi:hypothetical protein